MICRICLIVIVLTTSSFSAYSADLELSGPFSVIPRTTISTTVGAGLSLKNDGVWGDYADGIGGATAKIGLQIGLLSFKYTGPPFSQSQFQSLTKGMSVSKVESLLSISLPSGSFTVSGHGWEMVFSDGTLDRKAYTLPNAADLHTPRRYAIFGAVSAGRMWTYLEAEEGDLDAQGNPAESEFSTVDQLNFGLRLEMLSMNAKKGMYLSAMFGPRTLGELLGDKSTTGYNIMFGGFNRFSKTVGFEIGFGVDLIPDETNMLLFELGFRFDL